MPAGVPRAGQRRPWRAEVDRRQVSLSRGWWPAKPKYTRCGRPWRPARLLSAPARPCCVLCKSQPGPPSVVIVRWRQLTHWAAHLCSHKARPSAQGPGVALGTFLSQGPRPSPARAAHMRLCHVLALSRLPHVPLSSPHLPLSASLPLKGCGRTRMLSPHHSRNRQDAAGPRAHTACASGESLVPRGAAAHSGSPAPHVPWAGNLARHSMGGHNQPGQPPPPAGCRSSSSHQRRPGTARGFFFFF